MDAFPDPWPLQIAYFADEQPGRSLVDATEQAAPYKTHLAQWLPADRNPMDSNPSAKVQTGLKPI